MFCAGGEVAALLDDVVVGAIEFVRSFAGILVGFYKDNDYTEIEKFVKDKVKAIVCLGVDNTKLHKFFDGMVPVVEDARSMQECVDKCASLAGEGNTVLLSPCCASFDLFKSYEDRGEQFKNCVRAL